jgi:hypothetical protein
MTKDVTEIFEKQTVLMRTPVCGICSQEGEVEVPAIGFMARQIGALIQDAFPDLDKTLREQIVSGTHPACWEIMTGGFPVPQ